MKKRYVISYQCIFTTGYVRHSFSVWKSKEIKLNSHLEGINHATKFRSKIVADFFCWLFQKASDRNYDLRTYKVISI